MKKLRLLIMAFLCGYLLVSCGGDSSSQPATAEGFSAIENDVKSKFGEDAYFTELTIGYDNSVGNIISLTVTEAPETNTMEEWNQMKGNWTQNADITLEVPEGTKAADYMFQLNDAINLKKLGELVEQSSEHLKKEKEIDPSVLELAFIKFPQDGDISKAEYNVMLEPENGGTSFSYRYQLNGELISMDY